MSADPPPPPQVSPDGKFYWDGQRWLPMQTPAAQVQPQVAPQQYPPAFAPNKGHGVRNVSLGCIGLIILLIVIGLATGGGSKNQSTLQWTVDGRAITTAKVGGTDAVQITVTNNGPKASNFIIYLNSGDDWFKHHVITGNDGGCTINGNLERLDCGPLDSGATKTVNIDGSPKDAGNFDFEAAAADQEGSDLLYPAQDGVLTWSEAVTP